ncbi:glycosyltransferase [Phormidium tenue FACHB-886]|nr:glycosyltransferase [Phormidium tenue FACHB-886]
MLKPQTQLLNAGLVSVIILHCEGRSGLARAIDSALAQASAATEVIVVQSSLDASPGAAGNQPTGQAHSTRKTQSIVTRYPQVRFIYSENPGIAAACNAGLWASQGDYVLFLNSHDRLLPRAIQAGMACLEAMPECGFSVGIARKRATPGLPLRAAADLYDQILGVPSYRSLLSGSCFTPSARVLFRRSVFEQIGGFDEGLSIAAEYDLHLRAAAAFTSCRHNQTVVEYRELAPVVHLPVPLATQSLTTQASSVLLPSQALQTHLNVLRKQKNCATRSLAGRVAYEAGKRYWCSLYGPGLVREAINYCRQWQVKPATQVLQLLLRYYPQGLSQLSFGKN